MVVFLEKKSPHEAGFGLSCGVKRGASTLPFTVHFPPCPLFLERGRHRAIRCLRQGSMRAGVNVAWRAAAPFSTGGQGAPGIFFEPPMVIIFIIIMWWYAVYVSRRKTERMKPQISSN
jgi:hypothetical protein